METPKPPSVWSRIGQTPMTDPRSLGSSILFHGLLLALASAVALSATMPEAPEASQVLRGEVDPVDNRAKPGEGGGSAGELGGERLATALDPVALAGSSTPSAAPAEALISEILPQSNATAADDATKQVLPGPQTSSFGLIPGPGPGGGGGGGNGGGVGGGVGRGVGPGTEFFGARENAGSFAYVIDCSGSMATRGSLDVAKRELINSVDRLPPDARFGVIFYNLHATVLTDPQGRRSLMAATAGNKGRVSQQLARIVPDGGTDHMTALRAALALRPEVIFFLTDADLMTSSDAQAVIADAGKTRIQCVEFGRGIELGGTSNPLRTLAHSTGGVYRYIDVTTFPGSR